MIRTFIAMLLLLSLAGCALLTGNATYVYERVNQDGSSCTLNVDSGRTVQGGVGMTIGNSCELQVQANGVGQGGSSIPDLNGTLDRLLLLKAATPPPPPTPPPEPPPTGFGLSPPPDG